MYFSGSNRSSIERSPCEFCLSDGAGRVLLKQAPSGTGIIAGGAIRAACEVIGIKDIVAKSLGSSNPINVLRACLKGLKSQNSPKEIAKIRGKKIAEVTKKKTN